MTKPHRSTPEHWATVEAYAQSTSEERLPSVEEICKVLTELRDRIDYDDAYEQGGAEDELKHAYDLIERLTLHERNSVKPIALSERVPSEADCDKSQWVWAAGPKGDWTRTHWCMKWQNTPYKWWLPYWVLPLPPTSEGDFHD
jgi:hypothetical protein